jgi:hypothetical protein
VPALAHLFHDLRRQMRASNGLGRNAGCLCHGAVSGVVIDSCMRLSVTDRAGVPATGFRLGDSVCFELETEFAKPLVDPNFGVVIHSPSGEPRLDPESIHSGLRLGRVEGRLRIKGTVANLGLYPGRYLLTPWITAAASRPVDIVRLCTAIEVIPTPGPFGDLRLDPKWGKYWVPSSWEELAPDDIRSGL